METPGPIPATPPLLARRAVPASEPHVVWLLGEVPVDPAEVAGLVRQRVVLVLTDITRHHRHRRSRRPLSGSTGGPEPRNWRASLWPHHLRRRGLGRRLLTGALMLLRARGFERVHACAMPDGATASLLASAGFTADGDIAQAGGRGHFLLVL